MNNILKVLLVIIIGYIALKIYEESDVFQLKCVISEVNGKTYCVRDRQQVNKAANLLAHTSTKCSQLVSKMKNKYQEHPITKRLTENFNPKKMQETLPTSMHTAYSENKGEKLAFCLNKFKNGTQLIDENTLMFVALHELSHIATEEIGHTPQYWRNFKFLLQKADEFGLYQPVDYKNSPKQSCGMKITDNPYFDV